MSGHIRSRIRMVWDIGGEDFFTETERSYVIGIAGGRLTPTLQERMYDWEEDARNHLRLAREGAKMSPPAPKGLEYYRITQHGEAALTYTPYPCLATFAKVIHG